MATAAVGGDKVFVYGSLMADEVISVLLKRVPQSAPAILQGFQRFSIKGRVYPAILPVDSKNVAGKVLLGITDPELDVLDTFEDVEYERCAVEITLIEKLLDWGEKQDTTEKLMANAYVWRNKEDQRLYGDWNFEEWKLFHMKDFLAMADEFMEELEQPDSKTRVSTYESFFQQDSK